MTISKGIIPVEDPKTLKEYCNQLQDSVCLAIDTEFTRRRTYYSKLQLIQIAAPEAEFCIDPTCCSDLDVLKTLYTSSSRTIIFHSATQDIEVLYPLLGYPEILFDTQIAAVLCGYRDFSYKAVVKQALGVELSKDMATSDWNKRPFLKEQLMYAMDDVRYLLDVYGILSAKLREAGRLDWLREECENLIDSHRKSNEQNAPWKSFHKGENLPNREQQIAKKLLIWREQRARLKNLPRNWILTDQQIIELAKRKPRNYQQLVQVHRIGKKAHSLWTREILSIVNSSVPKKSGEVWKRKDALSEIQIKRSNTILKEVKKIAKKIDLPAEFLCTRREAECLARGDRQQSIRLLSGWRFEQAGSQVLSLVE